MTHAELVTRAYRWVQGSRGCKVAFAELSTAAPVIPDVIGFGMGTCELIEAKVSRSDFRRDRDKVAHRAGTLPGSRRWYLTPPGLVSASELPEGWGLAECHPRVVRVVLKAPRLTRTLQALQTEALILTSVARRFALGVAFDTETGRFAPYGSLT